MSTSHALIIQAVIVRITVYLQRANEPDRSNSFLWHNNFKSIHLLVHGGGASVMTNFLLIILIASVWVNIWIALRIAKSIDKPDLSKEDATVKDSTARADATTEDIDAAIHNLPPQNK